MTLISFIHKKLVFGCSLGNLEFWAENTEFLITERTKYELIANDKQYPEKEVLTKKFNKRLNAIKFAVITNTQ